MPPVNIIGIACERVRNNIIMPDDLLEAVHLLKQLDIITIVAVKLHTDTVN